jgi:hypothetical protein
MHCVQNADFLYVEAVVHVLTTVFLRGRSRMYIILYNEENQHKLLNNFPNRTVKKYVT